jgi:hypothetical protein
VPHYGWIDHERSRPCGGAWQADWIQSRAGIREREGKEPDSETGVRLSMLGAKGTRIYAADGPLVDAPPHHRLDGHVEPSCPLVLVRRKAKAATFAAIHEPYTDRSAGHTVSRLEETSEGIGLKVETGKSSDRVLVAFAPASGSVSLISPEGEAFRFTGYGFVRIAGGNVVARGKFEAFRVRTDPGNVKLTVNGKSETAVMRDGFVTFGELPDSLIPSIGQHADAEESTAALHSWFLPEEVRLKAGGERKVSMTLRAAGSGEVSGSIRFTAPEGISVEPSSVDLAPPLAEGGERRVELTVKCREGLTSGLFEINAEPVGDTPAAAAILPVSVGVVLKKDRRIPRLAQWVARAPNYTMKIDEFSGVGTYLLDADGHRRFGRFATGNFLYGFGGLQRGNEWIFRAQQACQQVWSAPTSLTFLSDGRQHYEFLEDRIVIRYLNPSRAAEEQTMWLANFDALEPPVHNGTQRVPHEPVIADWLYFPHPEYRQGVLVRFSKKTAVTMHIPHSPTVAQFALQFPMRSGDEVSLSFATKDELPK